MKRTAVLVAGSLVLAALSAAAWAVGALKVGDSVESVTLPRPSLRLADLRGTVTLVNFNGWT